MVHGFLGQAFKGEDWTRTLAQIILTNVEGRNLCPAEPNGSKEDITQEGNEHHEGKQILFCELRVLRLLRAVRLAVNSF